MQYRIGSAAAALTSLVLSRAARVAQDKAAPAAQAPPRRAGTPPRRRKPGREDRHAEAHPRHRRHPLGVRETSVPFSFLDAQKQPQGYSVDLCLRVAEASRRN